MKLTHQLSWGLATSPRQTVPHLSDGHNAIVVDIETFKHNLPSGTRPMPPHRCAVGTQKPPPPLVSETEQNTHAWAACQASATLNATTNLELLDVSGMKRVGHGS